MIRIVTDSMSDIRQEEAKRENVVVLAQPVLFDNETYMDGETISCEEFYEKMEKTKDLPKTSQVPPESFALAFTAAIQAGDEVVCITGSSVLSGTFQGAMLARSMVDQPEKIHIIDSLNASLGQQIVIWEAARLRLMELPIDEILDRIKELVPRVAMVGHIGNLKHLVMGGRLSAAKARIGATLNLKPTLRLVEGALGQESLTRGTRRANEWVLMQMQAQPRDLDYPVHLAAANAVEDLAVLRGVLDAANMLGEDVREVEIGPIIGTHTGPGVLAAAWVVAH